MQYSIKQIIEIVGIISVVISLLFVGYQLMLDRRVALANAYFDRAESFKSDNRSRMESESYMSMTSDEWSRGFRPEWWTPELESDYIEQELTGEDVTAKILSFELGILHLDNLRFQYEQGLYPDFAWFAAQRIGFASLMSDPIGQAVVYDNPRGLGEALQEFLAHNEQASSN